MVVVVVGGGRECDGLRGHGSREEEEKRDGGDGSRHRLIGEPGQLAYILTVNSVQVQISTNIYKHAHQVHRV